MKLRQGNCQKLTAFPCVITAECQWLHHLRQHADDSHFHTPVRRLVMFGPGYRVLCLSGDGGDMSEQREYRMLSDWYEDLTTVWLEVARVCWRRMDDSLGWKDCERADWYMKMTHKASLRAGRYARLAEKAKAQHQSDLTNVTPIKANTQ